MRPSLIIAIALSLGGCKLDSQCNDWVDQTWAGYPVNGKQSAVYMSREDISQPVPDVLVLSGYTCNQIQGDFFPDNFAVNQGSYFKCTLQKDLPHAH